MTNTGNEPKKPSYTLNWPKGLSMVHPDVSKRKILPFNLPRVLHALDEIREVANKDHIQFIMTSFVWLPHKGMKLKLPQEINVYKSINDTYWPLSYGWIHQAASFQNRVFKAYAQKYHLPFVDIAKYTTLNPYFFTDAVHGTFSGIKLRAWIAFQQLVPLIDKKIKEGKLPSKHYKPNMAGIKKVEYGKNYMITLSKVKQLCKERVIAQK